MTSWWKSNRVVLFDVPLKHFYGEAGKTRMNLGRADLNSGPQNTTFYNTAECMQNVTTFHHTPYFSHAFCLNFFRSQWPRELRRGSAASRVLGLQVRIPPGT